MHLLMSILLPPLPLHPQNSPPCDDGSQLGRFGRIRWRTSWHGNRFAN